MCVTGLWSGGEHCCPRETVRRGGAPPSHSALGTSTPREKQRGEVVSMQRITSTSCLQRWLYRRWRWRCPDWANSTTMEDRPRLPLEILEQIVLELRKPCSLGDPVAQRTLSALSLVSRTVRHWALAAKYSVVVAPRHVREFRKWHGKVHEEMVGYNRALFVALDDVSQCRTCV